MANRITALVTRVDGPTHAFATDESTGRSYFVHKKHVSEIGDKGWDWIAATIGDYEVRVSGVPVDQGKGSWILLEVRVL